MAEKGRSFVIAGGGIAGLTLALSLAKFGATVTVLERNSTVSEFGAGLQISPNARRILDRLGIGKLIAARAFEPEALDVYPFTRQTPITSMRFGETAAQRFGAPYAVMHRADLVDSLHQACKKFANIDILFGVRDFDLVSHARGLTVSIDEADGRNRIVRPFAFIGADGVNSLTRFVLLEGPPARYSGYVAWRTLLPLDALTPLFNPARSSLLCGPGYHAVLYPLPHRGQANVALFTRVPDKALQTDAPPGPVSLPKSATKSAHFRTLLEAGGKDWTYWPLFSVRTPHWHHGAVGLIGDAAHAMLPFQAQGAAMAIEDAAILAPLLITEPDAESALRRYQGLRLPRATKVAKISAMNGRIFHLRWPFSQARDVVLGAGSETAHLNRLAWLYGYDPAPELPTRPPDSVT